MTTKRTVAQREADILAGIRDHSAKHGPITRKAEVVSVDVEARTVELAFSSEAEVRRWGWIEVLSHESESVELQRINDGGALLDNHNWDKQRGVVERAWLDSDRRCRALVRFSKAAAAEELFQDVQDGIKRHVSVGYFIRSVKLTEEREGDFDVYTVTRWEPYEISIVSVPADPSVGVGRSAAGIGAEDIAPAEIPPEDGRVRSADDTPTKAERAISTNEGKGIPATMKLKTVRDASGNLVRAKVNDDGSIAEVVEVLEQAGEGERASLQRGGDAERARVRSLTAAAGNVSNVEGVGDMLRTALAEGHSVEQFQRSLLEKLNDRASTPLSEQARGADIGMTAAEIGKFSLLRVARALAEPTNRALQEEAAFEFDASRAAIERNGKSGERFVIPTDVLRSPLMYGTRAPLNTGGVVGSGTAASGSNLVATTLQASSFIDILRNRATIMSRGRVIGGLVGNIDIPKQLAAAQGYWLGEDDDATETGIELGQIPMTPKTVAAFTEVTRRMLMQSSMDVESMLREDLAKALALTIDKAGYYGTGSDHQPRGIANYVGLGVEDFAVAGKPSYAELVNMETEVALDNADVNDMVYVGNAGFRGHCKTTLKFAGVAGTIWEQGGTVNGYATEITNQVNAGDVFFGNFADLLIAMWGGLELTVDPFSNSKKGRTRLVVFQDVDFALRRIESFRLGRLIP